MFTLNNGTFIYSHDSAINIIDEALDKPRLTKARETLEEVKNQLDNY